jgi:hypothetical protein
MTYYIKALLVLTIFASCDHKDGGGGGGNGDNGGGNNTFSTRDSAISSVIQSLPQIFNADQKKLYGLTDADMKSLSPGADISVRYITYDDILRSQDSSLTNMTMAPPTDVLVPLVLNGAPKAFVGLSSDKSSWKIESVGNRRFAAAFRDPANAQRAELISIPGLEVELVRVGDSVATRGTYYTPVVTVEQADLVAGKAYSDVEVMRRLRTYAQVLSRQYGDKLKTGEIDR